MSQPYACSFQFEDDFEEIPNQFEENKRTPFSYNSSKLHSNITLNRPIQKDAKKSQITQYLQKAQQYLHNKTQKISLLKDQMEHRIMNDCTFKPTVNKSRSKSARNIKQFLDSQQRHLEKIEQKKEILKQRIQQQNRKKMTFSPTINHSKGYRNKQNVHERLYKQKEKDEKSQNYCQTFSHMPKITARGQKLVRNMPVGELLYQDARRRADRQYDLPQAQQQITQKNHMQQKYAAQKFLKAYKNALCHANLQQKTQYSQEEFTKIMIQLGYARYSATHHHSLYQQQKKLLQDSFSYLQQTGVTQINVYVFLLSLSGIYNIDLNNEEITGVLVIQQEEGRKIHQYFDLLFRNRLFADVSRKEQKVYVKDQNHFKPSINSGSQAMAQKYRQKMIEKANSIFSKNNIDIQIVDKGITHEDLLVICNLGQNLEKQRMRQRKMEEKDPQCTFQPNSQKYSLQFTNSSIGKDKCKQLYENAKAKQQEIQKLATFRSFQQKKHLKSELISPRPNNKNSNSTSKSNIKSYLQIKDVDKTLARMVAGRQQRNQRRQLEQRGERIPKKVEQKYKKSTEKSNLAHENVLLLDADIMVNNQKKKIYIYKGQQNKVSEIVQKFAIQCELDQYSRNILQEKLIESIKCLKLDENSIIDTSF